MKKLIKKRVITLTLLAITSTIFMSLLGRGVFNEDNAKQESRIVLDKFLKVSDTKTVITSYDQTTQDTQKVTAFVDNKCKKYFTKDFIDDTDIYATSSNIFYLSNKYNYYKKVDEIRFYNNYRISIPTVDKENEIVTYELKSNEIAVAPEVDVLIQMKKENGNWKINKANNY